MRCTCAGSLGAWPKRPDFARRADCAGPNHVSRIGENEPPGEPQFQPARPGSPQAARTEIRPPRNTQGHSVIRFARSSLLVIVGFLVVALCKARSQPEQTAGWAAASPRASEGPMSAVAEFRGSGSCSAVACHGAIAPSGAARVLGNEHTTWISDDRHSRAYQTLFNGRSESIARNLAGDRAGYKPAAEDERCLACHTSPRSADGLRVTRWMNQDGVGCESCHGPARRWLGLHTTEAWRQIESRRDKEAYGFVDTKSLAGRARVCAGCHVGALSQNDLLPRDVNHDLIAAGHPRLDFELSASLENMPAHWEEKDENSGATARSNRAADFPARAWAVGQLVGAIASLELSSGRALAPSSPWPELAEYGCFSCHHDLRDQAWRRRPLAGPARGTLVWGTRAMPMVRELALDFIADPAARRFTDSIEQLTTLMSQSAPERSRIAASARTASDSLGRCLETLATKRFDANEVENLLRGVNRPQAWESVASWDEAVERYLALVALYQARSALAPDSAPGLQPLRREIEELLQKLKFPPGFDSPRGFDPSVLPRRR
jgi:Cytochrome c554 and c-prime